MTLKKFSVLIEVELDQKKYDEVESWGISPSDYVASIISDHARDRGLIIFGNMLIYVIILEHNCINPLI